LEWSLTHQEAVLRAPTYVRDQGVSREPTPGWQILNHREFRRENFQERTRRQGIDMFTDQQQQAIAAIKIASIKAGGGRIWMLIDTHSGSFAVVSRGYQLIRHTRHAARQELDEFGAADDFRALHEFIFIESTLFETWRAHENRPTSLDKIGHELFERRKPGLMNIIRVAFDGKSHAFGAQKNQGFLFRTNCSIGYDKGHGRLVRIILGIG
jgi:hypothetical protein